MSPKVVKQENVMTSQPYPVGKGPILRMPALTTQVGLSPSMLYEIQKPGSPYYDPTFPAAVRLSGKAVGWFEGEVNAWLESRPRVRVAANGDNISSANLNVSGVV